MMVKFRRTATGLLASLACLALVQNAQAQRGDARRPEARGVVKAVDVGGNAITVSVGSGRETPMDKVFSLAPNAEVAVGNAGFGRGIAAYQEAKLADVVPGVAVFLGLSADEKTVESILADEPSVRGTIQKVDAGAKSISVVVTPAARGEPEDVRALSVADDAEIAVDDGRGRRLSIKAAKLSDVPVGAAANVRLSADQGRVMQIRAEGPTVQGVFKSVDAEKGTITITIPRGREVADERTLNVAKDARILSEGVDVPLGNLKAVENGPYVQLKLTLDQSQVQLVNALQPGRR